jgi:cytochrome P450
MSTLTGKLIPPGPSKNYGAGQELLNWMDQNFNLYGDIFKASIYETSVYFIRAPGYAQHILRKNWQNYRKGLAINRIAMLLGKGLMVSEGEFWKSQRQMIQPAFHRDAVRALTSVMEAANVTLLKKWEDAAEARTAVNLSRDVSHMVLRVLLSAIFGTGFEKVLPHFEEILCEESERNLAFAQAFRRLRKVILNVVEERRKDNLNHTDILGVLMEARGPKDGLRMPNSQLANEIVTIIVAGHETTVGTINLIWFLLSQNPEVEHQLFCELNDFPNEERRSSDERREFPYTHQVIEEALRLYPPGWLMTRKALKDDVLGDYFVPAGTEIYIPPYFIQRHPDFWESPNHFKPDRFEPSRSTQPALTMLPFSAGPRNCIGEFFARSEIRIHLVTIAKRLRLRYSDNVLLDLEAGVNLRNKFDFIMEPEIRDL